MKFGADSLTLLSECSLSRISRLFAIPWLHFRDNDGTVGSSSFQRTFGIIEYRVDKGSQFPV